MDVGCVCARVSVCVSQTSGNAIEQADVSVMGDEICWEMAEYWNNKMFFHASVHKLNVAYTYTVK